MKYYHGSIEAINFTPLIFIGKWERSLIFRINDIAGINKQCSMLLYIFHIYISVFFIFSHSVIATLNI